jgi:RNA polymerase sigma-70 factor (ECF subfamily)
MEMELPMTMPLTWILPFNAWSGTSSRAETKPVGRLYATPAQHVAHGPRVLLAVESGPAEVTVNAEVEWVMRSTAGDHRAFEALVKAYGARVYTHVYRLVGNREEAEDLTQETFLRAYRSIASYDPSRPFKNWIYAIATRVAFNALRSSKRRNAAMPIGSRTDTLDWREPESPEEGPRHSAARSDVKARIANALLALSPQSAALVHMHYYEGMTLREAAEVLGVSAEAAKVAMHRARKRLRELLVDEDWRNDLR